MRSYVNHFKQSYLSKSIVTLKILKLYTVLKMMNIEYTVIFVTNFVLNENKKIILN